MEHFQPKLMHKTTPGHAVRDILRCIYLDHKNVKMLFQVAIEQFYYSTSRLILLNPPGALRPVQT